MMVAQVCGLEPGDFVHTFGDVHLYMNHIDQAREQLTREPRALPTMKINPRRKGPLCFPGRGFRVGQLRPAPAHQSAGERLI